MSKKPEKVIKDLAIKGGPDITTPSIGEFAACLQNRGRGTAKDFVPLINTAVKEGWFVPLYEAEGKPDVLTGYRPNRMAEEGELVPRRAADKPLMFTQKPSRFGRTTPASTSAVAL